MTLVKRIVQYFYKYEYPTKVREAFFRWFYQSTHSIEKEKVLSELWEEAKAEADESTWQSFSEVSEKLGWTEEQTFTLESGHWKKQMLRIASVLILPLITGLTTWYLMRIPAPQNIIAEEIRFVECFVANGEIKTITLPDGSQVTVNSGSILIYPEHLSGEERSVYLNGEAYFEVQPDPEKPFVVKANGMDVKVLGTKFDVMAYSDQSFVSTILEEGSVEVRIEEEQILLNPNEKLTYNRVSGEILHNKVESDYIAAWREGNLIFQQATLDEIIRTLEHRYNINVYLNSSAYQNELITAKFVYGEDLEEALSVLKQLIPAFSYEIVKPAAGSGVEKVFIR